MLSTQTPLILYGMLNEINLDFFASDSILERDKKCCHSNVASTENNTFNSKLKGKYENI